MQLLLTSRVENYGWCIVSFCSFPQESGEPINCMDVKCVGVVEDDKRRHRVFDNVYHLFAVALENKMKTSKDKNNKQV